MSAAIIILNYNDSIHTGELASKIRDYACFDQIILVDNCSPDGSYEQLLPLSDGKIDVVKTAANKGYAQGNHFGIRHAARNYRPDYIFIANPDTFIQEKDADKILSAMASHPKYGILTALVNQGCNVWNLPGFWGVIESLFLVWFNLHKRSIKKRLLASKKEIETVGVVEGSFLCIRTAAYEAAGGLDGRTFLYGEEIMLARRMKAAGFLTGILPDTRYDHFHSVSIKKEYHSSKAKAFHHFHDSFRLYNKEYLHTNALQDLIFEAAYGLAWLERVAYDVCRRFL